MARKFEGTWKKDRKQWFKKVPNDIRRRSPDAPNFLYVSPKQLGVTPETKDASWEAANKWFREEIERLRNKAKQDDPIREQYEVAIQQRQQFVDFLCGRYRSQ